MRYIKRFLRQDRDYYLKNQADIRRQNAGVLRTACLVYLAVLATYTAVTVVSGHSKLLSVLYYVYDAIHLALCAAVLGQKDVLSAKRASLFRILLECTVLSFFVLEAVFPFPEQHAVYYPFPIILLVMVFYYRFSQALTLVLCYVGAFALLSCVYKTGDARMNDLYVASGTLISALAGYLITSNLRFETGDAMGRLRFLSMTDTLTGLYNKKTFESLCRAYIEGEDARHGYALLFIDVDRFKQINDRFGHQAGDSVLQSIAGALRDTFYEKDFLCRFGGDEFVVFMVDIADETAVRERVRSFQEKVRLLSKTLRIDDLSCSVGVAAKRERGESYPELLARADAALYVAKRSDGKQVSFAEQHFKQSSFQDAAAFIAQPEVAPEVPPAVRRVTRRTVLIVDDNELNRRVLRKILSTDYEVLEAKNGRDALMLLAEAHERISAVLLDLIMPVLDGYGVLAAMRADERMAPLPVIVTTGSSEAEAEVKALSLGANDFIVKPYQPAIILHRLKNTINLRETAAIVNAVEKDALTGVYTKAFFYDRAEALLHAETGARYDIVCCDIEHFKLINDLFGEKTGDALLRYVADLLARERLDTGLCGRIGADQFACVIPHRESYSNTDFERGQQRVNAFPISIYISLRHGIYTVEDTSVPVSTMCDRALTACNSVKGKYGVFFAHYDDSFRRRALNEQFIVDSMKAALSERQFQVYYQPKFSLETGELVGAEALVRWVHPERGFMSPGEFIPLFERNGFITDMDTYVWETVCGNLRSWIDAGKNPLPVSVNVSRTDIYNPALPDILLGLIETYGLETKLLHLEITETAYMEDSGQLVTAVGKLRSLGFIIEMDDFGAGYSSLSMLSEMPVDILKLDMSLISESANERKRSVLRVITFLSEQLGLPMLTEGVETAAQADMLLELGCSYAQGYFFARPMPLAEFEMRYFSVQQGKRETACTDS